MNSNRPVASQWHHHLPDLHPNLPSQQPSSKPGLARHGIVHDDSAYQEYTQTARLKMKPIVMKKKSPQQQQQLTPLRFFPDAESPVMAPFRFSLADESTSLQSNTPGTPLTKTLLPPLFTDNDYDDQDLSSFALPITSITETMNIPPLCFERSLPQLQEDDVVQLGTASTFPAAPPQTPKATHYLSSPRNQDQSSSNNSPSSSRLSQTLQSRDLHQDLVDEPHPFYSPPQTHPSNYYSQQQQHYSPDRYNFNTSQTHPQFNINNNINNRYISPLNSTPLPALPPTPPSSPMTPPFLINGLTTTLESLGLGLFVPQFDPIIESQLKSRSSSQRDEECGIVEEFNGLNSNDSIYDSLSVNSTDRIFHGAASIHSSAFIGETTLNLNHDNNDNSAAPVTMTFLHKNLDQISIVSPAPTFRTCAPSSILSVASSLSAHSPRHQLLVGDDDDDDDQDHDLNSNHTNLSMPIVGRYQACTHQTHRDRIDQYPRFIFQ